MAPSSEERSQTLEAYLERLEPHLPLVQEDLRLAAISLQALADASPDLLDATDNSLTTTRTIVDKRRELATTLTRAHDLVETADEFLRDQKRQIIVTLANAATAFDALYDHRVGLADGFRSFVTFAERGSKGFSDGPFLQTDVFIKVGVGGEYTAADCPRYGPAAGDNCSGGDGASSSAPGCPSSAASPAARKAESGPSPTSRASSTSSAVDDEIAALDRRALRRLRARLPGRAACSWRTP